MKPFKLVELTNAQRQQERIILDSFLRPGDEVIVARQSDWNSDGYAQPLPADGTRAWVVGHSTYFNIQGRVGIYKNRPGIYRRYGHAVLQYFDDKGVRQFAQLSAHQLIFADPNIQKQQDRRVGEVWDMYHEGVRVGDLPETPVVEGDIVKVSGRVAEIFSHKDGLARVEAIEWNWGTVMDQIEVEDLSYRLTPINGGFTTTAKAREIQLHERGNYYWYEEDPSQLKFADLREKAAFYKSVGLCEELRNPASDNYAWSKDQALDYLSQGKGAGITVSNPLFGALREPDPRAPEPKVHLYDFPTMPELARAVREETLRGFGRTVAA